MGACFLEFFLSALERNKITILTSVVLAFREEKTAVGTGVVPLVCFYIPAYSYGAGTLCTTPTQWISVNLD